MIGDVFDPFGIESYYPSASKTSRIFQNFHVKSDGTVLRLRWVQVWVFNFHSQLENHTFQIMNDDELVTKDLVAIYRQLKQYCCCLDVQGLIK